MPWFLAGGFIDCCKSFNKHTTHRFVMRCSDVGVSLFSASLTTHVKYFCAYVIDLLQVMRMLLLIPLLNLMLPAWGNFFLFPSMFVYDIQLSLHCTSIFGILFALSLFVLYCALLHLTLFCMFLYFIGLILSITIYMPFLVSYTNWLIQANRD